MDTRSDPVTKRDKHNPYLFLSIVEKTPKDNVNVFATYMKDYQTKVKQANSE